MKNITIYRDYLKFANTTARTLLQARLNLGSRKVDKSDLMELQRENVNTGKPTPENCAGKINRFRTAT